MTRILFVDDEPLLLEGLRAGLRNQRRRWDMRFAGGAREALEVIGDGPVDILVTDMRMPGMDGAELLAEVRRIHPGTARIVLSGQTDEATSRRLVNLAHQCLAKPAHPDEIRGVLERTCWLRDLLADTRLREAAGGLDHLPVLPSVFAEVSRLSEDPRSTTADIAAAIASAPGLCAKVLQIANSAFFGRTRHMTDMAEAVVFLGLATVRCLVLSVEVLEWFDTAPASVRPALADVQRRALATGRLARRMALGLPGVSSDEAFLAGVLHDVGVLVLATLPPSRAAGPAVPHGEVGAYLLGLWGLPPTVVEAVAHHHAPRPVGDGLDLGLVVHVAQALVAAPDGEGASGGTEGWIDTGLVAARAPEGWLDAWRRVAAEEAGTAGGGPG